MTPKSAFVIQLKRTWLWEALGVIVWWTSASEPFLWWRGSRCQPMPMLCCRGRKSSASLGRSILTFLLQSLQNLIFCSCFSYTLSISIEIDTLSTLSFFYIAFAILSLLANIQFSWFFFFLPFTCHVPSTSINKYIYFFLSFAVKSNPFCCVLLYIPAKAIHRANAQFNTTRT